MTERILKDFPNELWSRLLEIVGGSSSLRDGLSLSQTCSHFYSSYPGQKARYLIALATNGLSIPSIMAEPKADLSQEASLLMKNWPIASPRSLFSLQDDRFLGRPHLFGQCLIDLSKSRQEILICPRIPTDSEQNIQINVINNPFPQWGPIRELSVDIDTGKVLLVYEWETNLESPIEEEGAGGLGPLREQRGIITLSVLSLIFGKVLSSPYHHILDRNQDPSTSMSSSSSPPSTFSSPISVGRKFLSSELKGSVILLAAQDQVRVLSWSLKKWSTLFYRPVGGLNPEAHLDLLSASFFPSNQRDNDAHCLVVMSYPSNSLHGKDWGSELEFYKVSSTCRKKDEEEIYTSEPDYCLPSLKTNINRDEQVHQPPDVSVSLPIKSKVKPAAGRGLNYVRTGCSKRERFGENDDLGGAKREVGDSLVVICVEGFIWLSTLSAFLDILYPVSALAIFGEDPTLRLGTEWVRGNLNRCSLSASDTAPVTPVSVSGWKLAVPWSRSPFSQQRGPKTQSGGPSASFVRFLDANPKHRDKKRIKDTVGEGQEKVHVNTMWWKEADRYIIYFDHALESYLPIPQASCDVLCTLEGARMVLSLPADTESGKAEGAWIAVATV